MEVAYKVRLWSEVFGGVDLGMIPHPPLHGALFGDLAFRWEIDENLDSVSGRHWSNIEDGAIPVK